MKGQFNNMDDSTNMVMPVAPASYAGNGGFGGGLFGGDGAWLLLFLVLCGGWGMGGFGGGMMWPMMMGGFGGGMGLDYLYPWLNNSQHISDGFRDQQTNTAINGIQNSITSGFGDVQLGIAGVNQNICQTGNGIVSAITGGFNSAEVAANARQMANMQQGFGIQSTIQSGFNSTAAATADLKYTIATEACADRAAVQNGIQTVLDKLCQLELDGYKREADQLRAENSTLKNQGFIANEINQQNEIFYNRLKNCPVNAVPVYGNQPIFTCGSQNGCGCNNGFIG